MITIFSYDEDLKVYGPILFCLVTSKDENLYLKMFKEITNFLKDDFSKRKNILVSHTYKIIY